MKQVKIHRQYIPAVRQTLHEGKHVFAQMPDGTFRNLLDGKSYTTQQMRRIDAHFWVLQSDVYSVVSVAA